MSRDRKELGGECAADILDKLADAHLKLSEGQGAELLWRDAADKALTPLDALKIYALKTSPGVRGGPLRRRAARGPGRRSTRRWSPTSASNLGVAFQILNDIKDWAGDEDNKLVAGQDVLAARPTLLLALALEGSRPAAARRTASPDRHSPHRGADAEELVARVRAPVLRGEGVREGRQAGGQVPGQGRDHSPTKSNRPSSANCCTTWWTPCWRRANCRASEVRCSSSSWACNVRAPPRGILP